MNSCLPSSTTQGATRISYLRGAAPQTSRIYLGSVAPRTPRWGACRHQTSLHIEGLRSPNPGNVAFFPRASSSRTLSSTLRSPPLLFPPRFLLRFPALPSTVLAPVSSLVLPLLYIEPLYRVPTYRARRPRIPNDSLCRLTLADRACPLRQIHLPTRST